ncbi:MAG: hypothetical protein IT532_11640 [Burkholderiales bacterium]|nr:hypothetical protein [Burkholderiales bacterium]
MLQHEIVPDFREYDVAVAGLSTATPISDCLLTKTVIGFRHRRRLGYEDRLTQTGRENGAGLNGRGCIAEQAWRMGVLPPIVSATEELLTDEPPVWVPPCTPSPVVCPYAFHPPGHREHEPRSVAAPLPEDATLADVVSSVLKAGISFAPDPNRPHDRGFRIVRWLKATGDLVLENEPVAVVDGSRARGNSVLRGFELPDPAIHAPESGRLVWRHPSAEPHLLFGLIQSTNALIDANMDHPIRSDLVPMIDAIITRLQRRSVARRRELGLFDKAGCDYLDCLGLMGREKGLRLVRRGLLYSCHRLRWQIPPPEERAPGWGRATEFEKEQLRKPYYGPASAQYEHAWTSVVNDPRRARYDGARMGLAFALPC